MMFMYAFKGVELLDKTLQNFIISNTYCQNDYQKDCASIVFPGMVMLTEPAV